jgi:Arc/MetJ-type ribon-helix-helix transcriptional regulator
MLGGRSITATLSEETFEVSAATGFPQVGVPSTLLWSLVVDELFWELNEGHYATEYADDIKVLINDAFFGTVSEALHAALQLVQQWCERIGLSISPSKSVIVPFIKDSLQRPEGTDSGRIQLSTEDKYLELISDKGLTRGAQLDEVTKRAYSAFWKNKGTKTVDGVLDVHYGGNTHNDLCHQDLVA